MSWKMATIKTRLLKMELGVMIMNRFIILCLFLFSGWAHAEQIIETFTPEDSNYVSGGWVLHKSDSYLGVRFYLDSPTQLDTITTNLGGYGSFFVGIASIDGPDSLPLFNPDSDPTNLVFYQTNSFTGPISSDVTTYGGITLNPGYYVLIIGGLGDFGIYDSGWMPGALDLSKSKIPLTDYLEYRDNEGGWVEFPESGIRIALTGQIVGPVEPKDTDGDGIIDVKDNCTLVPNPKQRDTDTDGYGNFCDPDFDGNLIVDDSDLQYMKSNFLSTDVHADLNGDGYVNIIDLAIMKKMFLSRPGPSGLVPDNFITLE
jgi:hypothetical protein